MTFFLAFIFSVLFTSASTGITNEINTKITNQSKNKIKEAKKDESVIVRHILEDDLYCTTGSTIVFNLLFTIDVRCVKCSSISMADAQNQVADCLMDYEMLGFPL